MTSPSVQDAQAYDLTVVGTGIRAPWQLSPEARICIQTAGRVFYGVADPAAEREILALNASAESLLPLYAEGKPRLQTYAEMVDRVLTWLRTGRSACMAVYGHPGICCRPTHDAIRRARLEGFQARMFPAISALDELFADLGIDPVSGCQMFDATEFANGPRLAQPDCHLILWQPGALGQSTHTARGVDHSLLLRLAAKLASLYGPLHTAWLYQASPRPDAVPTLVPCPIQQLPWVPIPYAATLYVPPRVAPA